MFQQGGQKRNYPLSTSVQTLGAVVLCVLALQWSMGEKA